MTMMKPKSIHTLLRELDEREQRIMTVTHRNARLEHAWLLKAEGLHLSDIGAALGVSRERARQMVNRFGRRMSYALRRALWRME